MKSHWHKMETKSNCLYQKLVSVLDLLKSFAWLFKIRLSKCMLLLLLFTEVLYCMEQYFAMAAWWLFTKAGCQYNSPSWTVLYSFIVVFVEWSNSRCASFVVAQHVGTYNEAARHGTRWWIPHCFPWGFLTSHILIMNCCENWLLK